MELSAYAHTGLWVSQMNVNACAFLSDTEGHWANDRCISLLRVSRLNKQANKENLFLSSCVPSFFCKREKEKACSGQETALWGSAQAFPSIEYEVVPLRCLLFVWLNPATLFSAVDKGRFEAVYSRQIVALQAGVVALWCQDFWH